MTGLDELIARLQKSEGPNYALELDIHTATMPPLTGGYAHPPKYMSSIDAALELFDRVLPETAGNLRLATNIRLKANGETHVQIFSHPKKPGLDPSATHRHPAIALCTAILKAAREIQP